MKPRVKLALPGSVRDWDSLEWEEQPRRLTRMEREVFDYLRHHPEVAKRVSFEEAIRIRQARDVAKFRAREKARFKRARMDRARRVSRKLGIPLLMALEFVNQYYDNWNAANAMAERVVKQMTRSA